MLVLSGTSLYSLYGGSAGTTSECSLYPEFHINCVCYNKTPLYITRKRYSVGRVKESPIYRIAGNFRGGGGGC